MPHLVSVAQLGSKSGRSFMNVEEDSYVSIGVWGIFCNNPTYLATNGIHFYLQQFDDQSLADEWLITLGEDWIITKLEADRDPGRLVKG